MTQPGGPATLYGVLYQILGSVDWAARIILSGEVVDRELFDATLILEPKAGGDIQVHTRRGRVVEQWKSKGGGGTWSLKSVIEEVLPDLYRAVGDARDPSDEFRFVTEGRRGKWKEASEFFTSLPIDISTLDHTIPVASLSGQPLSRRGLIDHIVSHIASLPVAGGKDRETVQDEVLHLLRHFQFVAEVSRRDLERKVDRFLVAAVPYREQIVQRRDQLCGSLLRIVADGGEVCLDPEAFLRDAGLNAASVKKLQDIAPVKRELDEILLRRLREDYGYESASDVRTRPAWPAESPVLMLSGESGQGKSWQLASIARHLSAEGEFVLLLPRARSAQADLQGLADLIFKTVLKFDQGKSLDRVIAHLRSLHGEALGTPVILIDGIDGIDHAEGLIRQDWREWGARAVLVVSPPAVAATLARRYADRVHSHVVGDLSTPELRELLSRRGRDLGVVPFDLRPTIARPLLASIYCTLGDDPSWNPRTEYELYERFWEDRLRSARSQSEFPEDEACLASLARSLLEPEAVYPWPAAIVRAHGIDAAMGLRLEQVGWLRRLGRGDCEIWHSRLLSWAVAEGLYDERRTGRMTTENLAHVLAEMWQPDRLFGGQRLNYVPMDVVWLVCDPKAGLEAPDVARLLATLIGKGRHGDAFLSETLPTVGVRILPALSSWLHSVEDLSTHPELAQIYETLLQLGADDSTATRLECVRLLTHPNGWLQGVACRVIAHFPGAEALEPLWQLRLRLSEEARTSKEQHRHTPDEEVFRALLACLPSNPFWLRGRIQSADPATEPIDTLAYLLAQLHSQNAATIWRDTREALIAKLHDDHLRALAYCVRRYGDRSLLPRIPRWLASEDSALAATAVRVLARLKPKEAVDSLKKVQPTVFGFFKNWWLPELLVRRRRETLRAIEDRLRAEPEATVRLADVVQGYENLMSEGVIDALLDSLAVTIRSQGEAKAPKDSDPVRRPLHLLHRVSSPKLLHRFEARAGSQLEASLTNYLTSRLNLKRSIHDSILEEGIRVLLRINSQGIQRLVRAGLRSSSGYERRRGALLAGLAPSGETLDLLRRIAAIEAGSNNTFREERRRALDALFGLGDVASTIGAVLRWGLWAAERASWMRSGLRPFTDKEVRRGLELASSSADPIANEMLVIAVSGRADFAGRVRACVQAQGPSKTLLRACLFALGELGDSSDEALTIMRKAIQEKSETLSALRALRRINAPGRVEAVVSALAVTRGEKHLSKVDFELLGEAYAIPEARRHVAGLIWTHIQGGGLLSMHESYLEALGELTDPVVREYVWEAAFSNARSYDLQARQRAAIQALARMDPVLAFSASVQTLRSGAGDRVAAARVLLDCDPGRAIPVLLECVADEPTAKVRWAIGRALRPHSARVSLRDRLRSRLSNPLARVRSTAAEIAGWLGPGFLAKNLEELVLEDSSVEVEQAAVSAVHRQEYERHARALLDEIPRASQERCWALAECLVTLADPILLRTSSDPCSLSRLGNAVSTALDQYLNVRIEQRQREVDDDARGADFAG